MSKHFVFLEGKLLLILARLRSFPLNMNDKIRTELLKKNLVSNYSSHLLLCGSTFADSLYLPSQNRTGLDQNESHCFIAELVSKI